MDKLRAEFADADLEDLEGQCGILERDTCSPFCFPEGEVPWDLAILQLARPVPHADIPDPEGAAAGDVLADSIPVASSAPNEMISAVAVGFGGTDGEGPRDRRRYARLTVTVNDVSGIIEARSSTLQKGDSGGPLLWDKGGGDFEVIGVASRGGSTKSQWASLGPSAPREWIASQLDRDGDDAHDIFCRRDRDIDAMADADNDPDGDWVLDADDTCPTTYNPCQTRGDIDGDGTDDDCDACPTIPKVDLLRGTDELTDDDRDGTPNVCDCLPGTFHWITPLTDEDDDWVFDGGGCDNCPGLTNPEQANRDGDDKGDLCDPCPDVEDVGTDRDGDGIPNACDNCIGTENVDQANCNVDGELAAGIAFFDSTDSDVFKPGEGDACDPVECPDTELLRTESTRVPGFRSVGLGRMELDALWSDGDAKRRSGFEFCRCELAGLQNSPEDRRDCADPLGANCEIGDDTSYDQLRDDPEGEETPGNPWRLITAIYSPGTPENLVPGPDCLEPEDPESSECLVLGDDPLTAEVLVPYSLTDAGDHMWEVDAAAGWQRMDDQQRWLERGFGDEPPFGATPGVLATHTPGPRTGEFDDEVEIDEVRADRRELSWHYWSGVVPQPSVIDLGLFEDLRRPVGPFKSIFPDRPDACRDGKPACHWAVDEDGAAGLLLEDGAIDGSRYFAPGIEGIFGAFAPDVPWVAAAESRSLLPDGGARYVALSPTGNEVLACLVATPFGLAPPGFQPGDVVQPLGELAESSGAGPVPPPRTDHAAVLSAQRRELWVVGGVNDEGEPLGDLWRYSTRTGRWLRLPLPFGLRPGAVLAATYSPAERVLWVLDAHSRSDAGERGRGGTPKRVRLLRLDPAGHESEVALEWPRVVVRGPHALATDPTGALYIASSRSLERGPHFVRRIVRGPEGELELDRTAQGEGPLAGDSAVATRLGLTLLVRRDGRPLPVGYGSEELRRLPPGARGLGHLWR